MLAETQAFAFQSLEISLVHGLVKFAPAVACRCGLSGRAWVLHSLLVEVYAELDLILRKAHLRRIKAGSGRTGPEFNRRLDDPLNHPSKYMEK